MYLDAPDSFEWSTQAFLGNVTLRDPSHPLGRQEKYAVVKF